MREAPAYQEYAATMLANARYRLMTLAQRGLLDTLRRECWVNGGLPDKPETLAKMLGFDAAEINAALPAVMPFFAIKGGLVVCPELDDLRATYADRRERMAEGGKRSAARRKVVKPENADGKPPSTLQGASRHPASTLQGRRQDKSKPEKSKAVDIEGIVPCHAYNEWMAEDADAYARATGGE